MNEKILSKVRINSSTLIPAFTIIIVVLILFIRRPDAFQYPQFWAEDGVAFFYEQFNLGCSAVWRPIAGYYLFLPRFVACFSSIWPYELQPALYNLSYLLAVILLVIYLFSDRIILKYKPALCLLIVLAPFATEVLMSITNIQWIWATGLLLLTLSESPASKMGVIFDLGILALIGFTGPFIIGYLPMLGLRYLLRRDRFSALLFVAASVIVSVQLSNISSAFVTKEGGSWLDSIVVIGSYFGNSYLFSYLLPSYYWLYLVSSLWFVGFCLISIAFFWKENTKNICLLPLAALIQLLLPIVKYINSPLMMLDAGRYFVIPGIFFLWSTVQIWPRVKWLVLLHLVLFFTSNVFLNPNFIKRYQNFHWEKKSQCLQQPGVECVMKILPPDWNLVINTGLKPGS